MGKIDIEIKKLIEQLQKSEQDYYQQDTPEIKNLRHFTLSIQERMESTLNMSIPNYLISSPCDYSNQSLKEYVIRLGQSADILLKLDFARKVEIALKCGIINKRQKNLLHKINGIRLLFAHPANYRDKLDSLKGKQEYCSVLKSLLDCITSMKEVEEKEFSTFESIEEDLKQGYSAPKKK